MEGFRFQYSSTHGPKDVVSLLHNQEANIQEILEVFEDFLLACGYRFEGNLLIAEDLDNANES